MVFARFKDILLTLLFCLGVFLVAENLSAFLHVLLHAKLQGTEKVHYLFAVIPAVLTALLGVALFALVRSRARDSRQMVGQLLSDKSRMQEEWLQTFNALPDFVSVHDRNFRIVRANSALCEFLGKKPEEIIGRYCYQLFHNRTTPIAGCPHAKTRDIRHAVTMEVNDPHLGVPLLITCSPFADAKGAFAGSVHMARIQTPRTAGHTVAPHLFIPICASCKDIRDEHGNWVKVEDYVRLRFKALLTHSICGRCQKKIYPQFFPELNDSSLPGPAPRP